MNDLITIAIPVFERFDYLPDALQSAINQTKSCEVIVVDNNSSHDQFKKYVEDLNLPHVKYYRNSTNVGMIENWNKCIEYATTDWITILHDDDLFSVHFIEEISALIHQYPNAVSFITGYEKTTTPNEILKYRQEEVEIKHIKPNHFLFGNITAFPGVVFNKKKINGLKFDPALYPVSDYNFWYKLSEMQPIIYLKKTLCMYRVSPIQDSATAYKKVIETTYFFRKEIIKFKNPLFKFFSLFELYKLYQCYRRDYKVAQSVKFETKEVNDYFRFFSNKYVDFALSRFIYKIFKKSFSIHSGY